MSTTGTRMHPVIGIDLGTTYSAVAAYDFDRDETVVFNNPEDNQPSTPSVVSFDRATGRVLVGQTAKRNLAVDPLNTIIEIKREMGEVFRPETLAKFDPKGEGGFRARQQVNEGYQGDPVKVRFCGKWRLPQEISAFTLMKMKDVAEAALGCEVRDAVITVPAYFTERQRKATEEAAYLAGLYPRQLIPEPTAAAICYGVDQYVDTRKVYLVYDLGGGTFDVSIISVEESNIEVLATSGDPRLGGGDFDDAITRWAVEQLLKQHQIDIRNNARAQSIVKYYAEELKIRLSTYESDSMTLPELRPAQPPTLRLDRKTYEGLIEADLKKSLSYVDSALEFAESEKGVRRTDIDAILLVGGSSKMPCVKARLLDYFKQEPSFVRANLDPDAVVARGAAILAKRFQASPPPFDVFREFDGSEQTNPEEGIVNLITEHSLGVGVTRESDNQSVVSRIIARGTSIPVSVTKGNYTNPGPTEQITVQVYQGEEVHVFENSLIGEIIIGPMEPKPKDHHRFDVTFSLDRNGLLTATVNHLNERKTFRAAFTQPTGIGGRARLAEIRKQLVELYQPDPTATPGQVETVIIVPQVPAPAGAPSNGNGNGMAHAPVGEEMPNPVPAARAAAATSPPPASPATPPQPSPEPAAAAAAASGGDQAVATVPELHVLADEGKVPEQFKSVWRRSKRLLSSNSDPRLIAALNTFVDALNQGVDGEPLERIGDSLEDVYLDCRA